MNAVRLMTIHASKGLEFEAVHISWRYSNGNSEPLSGRTLPPPEGMIAGQSGSVSDNAKAAHAQEEECLFFVAMSRARTYLQIYLPQTQSNGSVRNPSPYLPRVAAQAHEVVAPGVLPFRPRRSTKIMLTLPNTWRHTHYRIAAYEKCARRFFYTHILGIGSTRRATPFDRTHACIYELIDWLSTQRIVGEPSLDQTLSIFSAIWEAKGPVDHAFAPQYYELAHRLVGGLLDAKEPATGFVIFSLSLWISGTAP